MTFRDAVDTAIAKLKAGGEASSWDRQATAFFQRHFPAGQAQDDTNAQLERLIPLAEVAGLYDAADHLRTHIEISRKRSERRARAVASHAKGIPLVDKTDPDDKRGERCAFEDCRAWTNMWTDISTRTPGEQVAVCSGCAQNHAPCDVPTKHRWMERERLLHDQSAY